MTQLTDVELKDIFGERLKELPQVVRDAITSVDIKKQLQELANHHKLHLDQWQLLENEVMLTLLGLEEPERLQENIKKQVGLSDEIAASLAADISKIVFEPIREELERGLEHPEAKAKELSGVEAARERALSAQQTENSEQRTAADSEQKTVSREQQIQQTAPVSPPVQPATPPPTPPTEKAIRAPSSGAYKTGEASTARKDVHDDPYREPPA